MSLIKKVFFFLFFILIITVSKSFAEDIKKVGKYKDWEVMVLTETSGKICFAQSAPVLQAPKKIKEMLDCLLHLDLRKKFLMK